MANLIVAVQRANHVVQEADWRLDEKNWTSAMAEIRRSDAFLFALTAHSVNSTVCLTAHAYAEALKKPVLPVKVTPDNLDVTHRLFMVQFVPYDTSTAEYNAKLAAGLAWLQRNVVALPTPLLREPDVPFSDLAQMRQELGQASLAPSVATDYLSTLRTYQQTDDTDPELRNRVRENLLSLMAHDDVAYQTHSAAEELLDLIDRDPTDSLPPQEDDRKKRPDSAPDPKTPSTEGKPKSIRKIRRIRWDVAALIGILLVLVSVAATSLVARPAPDPRAAPPPPTETPSTAVALNVLEDSVLIGSSDAKTTIDVFNDPSCPGCANLITTYMEPLRRAIHARKLAVRFHVVTFLDKQTKWGYSGRAAAAAYCVAAANDPSLFEDFYAAIFAPDFQPKKGAPTAPDNEALLRTAERVGAPDSTLNCIATGQEVAASEARATRSWDYMQSLEEGASVPAVFQGKREIDIRAEQDWLAGLVR